MPKKQGKHNDAQKKKKKKTRRPKGERAGGQSMREASHTVGIGSQSLIDPRPATYAFGTAPPNDDYPEGGLRVAGEMPYGASLGTNATDASVCVSGTPGWYTVNVCPTSLTLLAPTNYSNGLTNSSYVTSRIGGGFSAYRYRTFGFEYEPTFTPGTTTASNGVFLQASWHADSGSQYWNGVSGCDPFVTNRSVRWPAWQPFRATLYKEGKTGRDDKLWLMPANGDTVNVTITTGDQAWIRSAIQAMVSLTCSATPAAAVALGKVKWFFTCDFYGMNVAGPVVLPSDSKGDEKRSVRGISVTDALRKSLRLPSASEDLDEAYVDLSRARERDERPVQTEPRQERKVARS